jgi:hypothetical protein
VRRAELLALAAVVAAGAAARLHGIASLPPGCWVDEAENGLETQRILDGDLIVFTPRHDGRGALQFYWAAPFFLAMGPGLGALRIGSAAAGILTLPAVWLLLRRLAGPAEALLGAGFLALSSWHMAASRVGFDVVLLPLLDALAVHAAVRAWDRASPAGFALAGLLAGLDNYGYTAARLSPLIVAGALVAFRSLGGRGEGEAAASAARRRGLGIALAVAAFVAVTAPLAVWAANDPATFFKRSRNVTIFKQVRETDSFRPVGRSFLDALRMFHERGDPNPRHHVPGAPLLDPLTGLALLAGLIAAWRRRKEPAAAFALGWLALIWVCGGVLTNDGPHANRTVSALLPIALLAAWGVRAFLRDLRLEGARAALAAAAVVLAAGAVSLKGYFVDYPKVPDLRLRFTAASYEVGRYVRTLPEAAPVYVSRAFHPSVVRFVSGRGEETLRPIDPGGGAETAPPGAVYILDVAEAAPASAPEGSFVRTVVEGLGGEAFAVLGPGHRAAPADLEPTVAPPEAADRRLR